MYVDKESEVGISLPDAKVAGGCLDGNLGFDHIVQASAPVVKFDQVPEMLEKRISVIYTDVLNNILKKYFI